MEVAGEYVLLRVYLRSADRTPLEPTWERLVKAARKRGMAGATVLKGILGAGSHGLAKQSAWSWVDHVPVIVETVDAGARILEFVERDMDPLMAGGMATLERANVMMYRHRAGEPSEPLRLGG